MDATVTAIGSTAAAGAHSLAGCRVVLTAKRRASELASALERRGVEIIRAPILSIVPHADDEQLIAHTRALIADPPDAVVATTGVGFRGWMEAADAAGCAGELLEVLRGARIIARGPKAQGAVHGAGLTADWVADSETAAEIKELFETEGVAGLHVAVQHHGAGSDGIDELLVDLGARVTSLVVYRWGPSPDPEAVSRAVALVAAAEVDSVAFTSAHGVVEFLAACEREGLRDAAIAAMAGPVLPATVGPVTAAPLIELGLDPLIPDRFRLGALVRELTAALSARGVAEVATPAGVLWLRRSAASLGGRALPLSQVQFSVLRSLVEAKGGVVSREEILAVLPGSSNDPHAAEVAVARLRDSMGDRSLVRTVPRRGYRLEVSP
ncbi:uroporphyrinogen-III synthase [Tessaracoccus sp. MC1679]|uniref:uroporphyrinogen-III synthase n=1 Tax=Tessaracoccus sp. MC1679 TaxID=2760313 RepID=UPI0015FEEFC4|nr:uroporphyrinogen-III synthase [Tessaracoccus sp. MC1679]MBB1514493.1 uroporphyrinogen-III synthase [Tessaracoccus sp. MC1679]